MAFLEGNRFAGKTSQLDVAAGLDACEQYGADLFGWHYRILYVMLMHIQRDFLVGCWRIQRKSMTFVILQLQSIYLCRLCPC